MTVDVNPLTQNIFLEIYIVFEFENSYSLSTSNFAHTILLKSHKKSWFYFVHEGEPSNT